MVSYVERTSSLSKTSDSTTLKWENRHDQACSDEEGTAGMDGGRGFEIGEHGDYGLLHG